MRGVHTVDYLARTEIAHTDQGKLTRPWANTVHTDALADLHVRQPTSECYNGTFGRSVVEKVRSTYVCVDGAAVDDGVALLHVRESVL